MRWLYLGLLVVSYFVYLLIGAGVFVAIERSNELQTCEDTRTDLIAAFKDASGSEFTSFTRENLANITKILKRAAAAGISIDPDTLNVTCASNWDFQNAFFFSGTVVTTIGYGNISPSTYGGRTFCIFYALIGIPLFAVMFSGLGEKIAKVVKKLDKKLKIKTKRTWVHNTILIFIVSASLCVLCLLIPAAIFQAVEGWSYHDSFYYSFITLTTIGFGDFVVGTDPDIAYISIYRVLVYFWILFGLAFMATAVSLISDFMKKTGEKATKNIGDIIDDRSTPDPEKRADGDGVSNADTGDDNKDEDAASDTRINTNHDPNYGASEETKRTEDNAAAE